MRIPAGTANYFSNYRQPERNTEAAYYCLSGDLNQMGIMENRLRGAGFNVVRSQSGTYPGFREQDLEEFKKALKHLFDCRISGWWGQRHKLIEYEICTEAEFKTALDEQVASGRD